MNTALRRGALVALIGLGSIVSAVGASGVFAPATDSARTGTSQKELVETGVFAPPAANVDLKLAFAPDFDCQTFSDDLATSVINVTGITENWFEQNSTFCLRNAGTSDTQVGMRVLAGSLTFADVSCSPGENTIDLQGCVADRLSNKLTWSTTLIPTPAVVCPTFDVLTGMALLSTQATRTSTAVSPAGATCKYQIRVASVGGSAIPSLVAADQTDAVRWQFEFYTVAA